MIRTESDGSCWYASAKRHPSDNCRVRPPGATPSLLVIHNISLPAGCWDTGHVIDLFCNRIDPDAHASFADLGGLRVSSHLLIDRRGRLCQFVPFDRAAWHAGVSCFDGRENCNEFSIGIELTGADATPFTQKQYFRLAAVTRALVKRYPDITPERIVGHSDIARPAGRKTDPGPAFDWPRYRALLAGRPGADTSAGPGR
ncbi:MAG: 1,6-anhydro-N-acetylmuramyl-L-alanine amidase AmpD [Gammaproteobacteria bacterium AqS3]|nr:1,6-anhydro-N-acetylmuramyl-L-alanine amidase AmpD [Gammaproteobacteria bacterium AqS3]